MNKKETKKETQETAEEQPKEKAPKKKLYPVSSTVETKLSDDEIRMRARLT